MWSSLNEYELATGVRHPWIESGVSHTSEKVLIVKNCSLTKSSLQIVYKFSRRAAYNVVE